MQESINKDIENITKKRISKVLTMIEEEKDEHNCSMINSIHNYVIYHNHQDSVFYTLEYNFSKLYFCVLSPFKGNNCEKMINFIKMNVSFKEDLNLDDIPVLEEDEDDYDTTENDCKIYNLLQIRNNYNILYSRRLFTVDSSLHSFKVSDYNPGFIFNLIKENKFSKCTNCSVLNHEEELGVNKLCIKCLEGFMDNYNKFKDTTCSICLDEDILLYKYKTKCNHIFHINCLKKMRNSSCPNCRSDIGYDYMH